MSIAGKRIGFLGAGNIGEAMIRGLLQAALVPAQDIAASDARPERLAQVARQHGIRPCADNATLVRESDVIVLAVKPQIMAAVCEEVARAGGKSKRSEEHTSELQSQSN